MMKEQVSAADQENMSNLTTASGEEASTPPTNQMQSSASGAQKPPSGTDSTKKKRKLPGNPDPDAEVVALSPTALLSSSRFVCEVCNKGFQRDQNLQLHRRGHNLPWKLRQRSSEARKKVYVCPEAGCVHHDPSRALGDLTGIKKHFCRKHGEKRWKCDKCSKGYAVQSDWKAHAKTCGTREYRCDCGTLFSRRDTFITHRAFCDALAEESARALAAVSSSSNPLASRRAFLSSRASTAAAHDPALKFPDAGGIAVKAADLATNRERQPPPPPQQEQWAAGLDARPVTPPWFACQHPAGPPAPPPTTTTPTHHLDQLMPSLFPTRAEHEGIGPFPAAAGPHMSATALLQKAAQIGSTLSGAADLAPVAAASHSAAARFRLGLHTHQRLMGSIGSAPAAVARSTATAYDDPSFQEVNSSDGVAGGGGVDELNTRDLLAGLRAISQREMDILGMAGLEPCMNSSSYHHPQQSNKPWN